MIPVLARECVTWCHPDPGCSMVTPKAMGHSSPAPAEFPFSGQPQMPLLLCLILPSFWVHSIPPQVNLPVYFAFSPDLFNRRTPRIIFAAGAAC